MISFLYKLKRSKFLLTLVILATITLILNLICVVFDFVQLIKVFKVSVSLAGEFLPFNIAIVALDVILAILFVIYLIVRKKSSK